MNACLLPLQWQTYDVNFTNAVVKDGKKVKNARMTMRLNGIVIHDNIEINGKTRRWPKGPGRHTRPDQAAGSQQPAAVPKRLDR